MRAQPTVRSCVHHHGPLPVCSPMNIIIRLSDTLSQTGDKASQSQFRNIIRQTFASPTLSSPISPPPPTPPPKGPLTPCETKAAQLNQRSASAVAPIEVEKMTEAEYAERLKHWREVAAILRQNVVQGRKVDAPAKEEEGDVWSRFLLSFAVVVIDSNTFARTPYHARHGTR